MSALHQRGRAGRGVARPGFTMIEMLVALFLASIGMVTVFGLQVAANVVQRHARDINAARMLGESFLSQLRGETVNWTTPGVELNCNATAMPLCFHAVRENAPGTWLAVPSAAGTVSPTFNALGIPNDPSDTRVVTSRARVNSHNQRYCIHYSLEPVATVVAPGELLRARVRVFWPLADNAFAPAPEGFADCGYGREADLAVAARAGQFRYLQLNAVLYRHEASL
jgi:prepilin-type N-terminal cleavage/methylation domain-containing protein